MAAPGGKIAETARAYMDVCVPDVKAQLKLQ